MKKPFLMIGGTIIVLAVLVLAFVFWFRSDAPGFVETVILEEDNSFRLDDYTFALPDDEYSAYLRRRIGNIFRSRSNEELRNILREEMFTIEKTEDRETRNRLLLYIASNQVKISYSSLEYDKAKDTIREIESTLSRVDPVLKTGESLDEIRDFGFEKYSRNEKERSDYFLMTEVQKQLLRERIQYLDSGGAVKTATEIFPAPERDSALLEILNAQLWPLSSNCDESDIRLEKAEKTLSHLGKHGRDRGLLMKFQWYFDWYVRTYSKPFTPAETRKQIETLLSTAKDIKDDKVFEQDSRRFTYGIVAILDSLEESDERRNSFIELARYLDGRITAPFARFKFRYQISKCKNRPPGFSDMDEVFEELRAKTDAMPDGNEKLELFLKNIYAIYEKESGRGRDFVQSIYDMIEKIPDKDISKFVYLDRFLNHSNIYFPEDELYEQVVSMMDKSVEAAIPVYWRDLAKNVEPEKDFTPEELEILWKIGSYVNRMVREGNCDRAVKVFEMDGIPENQKNILLDRIMSHISWSKWNREKDFFDFAQSPELPKIVSYRILWSLCIPNNEYQEGFLASDAWSAFIPLYLKQTKPIEKIYGYTFVFRNLPENFSMEIDPEYLKRYLPDYSRKNISGTVDGNTVRELMKKVIGESIEEMKSPNFDPNLLRSYCDTISPFDFKDAEIYEMHLKLFEAASDRFVSDPVRNFQYFVRSYSWNGEMIAKLPREKKQEILEMYYKAFEKIPDQPIGDKLNAYKDVIQFAHWTGQGESKKRIAEEALAFVREISDNPEELKKSPQISIPLTEIERLHKN